MGRDFCYLFVGGVESGACACIDLIICVTFVTTWQMIGKRSYVNSAGVRYVAAISSGWHIGKSSVQIDVGKPLTDEEKKRQRNEVNQISFIEIQTAKNTRGA